MGSVLIFLVASSCIFGGALLGMFIRSRLPNHHLKEESKDTIKVGAGMIATLAALVLGILVGSAKNAFDSANTAITQNSAKLVLVDRALSEFGPKAADIRARLRRNAQLQLAAIWPQEPMPVQAEQVLELSSGIEDIQAALSGLKPENEEQRRQLDTANRYLSEMALTRWLLVEQAQTDLPLTLFAVLVLWLSMLFMSFGLFAPTNRTVISVLLLCSLSVAAALFIISEMNQPLDGTVKVSSGPLRKAIEHLGKRP